MPLTDAQKNAHKNYFKENYKLSDLRQTDMLMLHNSWTPEWFKYASRDKILNTECTLSNILREST